MRILCYATFLVANGLCSAYANDTTYVSVRIDNPSAVKVTVKAPSLNQDVVRFVIPQIVPGTYMKINYKRFYHRLKAYTKSGERLPLHRKGNHIVIKKAKQLNRLEYFIEQSDGDQKVWDNILGCAGTIFNQQSYLFNFQLVSGYFEGFQKKPFVILFLRPKGQYGSTTLKVLSRIENTDTYFASSYSELIDSPVLYCQPDTVSFKADQSKIKISVYSETKKVTSQQVLPTVKKLMDSLNLFLGGLPKEEYNFIFYYRDYAKMKGMFKGFGLGSALEHKKSSVYYFSEPGDTTFNNLNWICVHEYLHKLTPLSIHSEKIEKFNFDKPDMSQHLWFYEGATDYLAALMAAEYKLPVYSGFRQSMNYATSYYLSKKKRSMTRSSENIIKNSIFNWPSKIFQLANFYAKGKLIAFCLDNELMIKSNDTLRLVDLMKKLNALYADGKPFKEEKLFDEIVKLSYPELNTFFNKYVVGKEPIPYNEYFSKLGWEFHNKKEVLDGYYGDFDVQYNESIDRFYVKKVKASSLNFKKGDVILSINNKGYNYKNYDSGNPLYSPTKNDQIKVLVKRNGKELELSGIANQKKKLKYSTISSPKEFTQAQISYRKRFYKE